MEITGQPLATPAQPKIVSPKRVPVETAPAIGLAVRIKSSLDLRAALFFHAVILSLQSCRN